MLALLTTNDPKDFNAKIERAYDMHGEPLPETFKMTYDPLNEKIWYSMLVRYEKLSHDDDEKLSHEEKVSHTEKQDGAPSTTRTIDEYVCPHCGLIMRFLPWLRNDTKKDVCVTCPKCGLRQQFYKMT